MSNQDEVERLQNNLRFWKARYYRQKKCFDSRYELPVGCLHNALSVHTMILRLNRGE